MHDPVNHPAHYTDGQIEVIDFIDDKQLSYPDGRVKTGKYRNWRKSGRGQK